MKEGFLIFPIDFFVYFSINETQKVFEEVSNTLSGMTFESIMIYLLTKLAQLNLPK